MAERKIDWTDQQRDAIMARGSDVLVTASAGTGKTAVLSGRCVSIVSDRAACPAVRNILVLTFTEMAAEEMRARITKQLADAFAQRHDPHLRHQIILLQGADISTIHSFCKRLITQYFHQTDLDPTFSVIDDDEAQLLKAEVLDKAVDGAWRRDETGRGLEELLRRRDLRTNDGFLARVIQLSSFLDGVVSRQDWCERAVRLAKTVDPAGSELGAKQKMLIAGKLRDTIEQLRHAQKLYEDQVTGGGWAARFEEDFIRPVADCLELMNTGCWDECAQRIRAFQKPRFSKPKDLPKALGELVHEAEKSAFECFGKLPSLSVLNPDYLDRIGPAVSIQSCAMIDLVQKFDQLYGLAKRTLNCLDFADLEHYALKLLTDRTPDGALAPSATALALRAKYKYIFVDEYQDINPVQQTILDALSSGDNVFVVGDVKQSIYAWRGAEPQIFLDRLKPASPGHAKTGKGLRIDLNANWRSAPAILNFINRLFARIMTAPFAKIDYDESAELRPGPTDESQPREDAAGGPLVEFHVLDEKSKDDADADEEQNNTEDQITPDIVTSRRRQAAMIARRISRMVGAETGRAEFQIYDKEEKRLRDVDYRDIVVLIRAPAKRANDYVEVLRLAGVPVSCEATAGYFEATEISDMLCLLKVLDNPQRDIELAAVLRSPFFNVADTELAKMKLYGKKNSNHGSFYNSVVEYSKSGGDAGLAARIAEILIQIEHWRTAARRGSIADMIWRIYRSTNYLSFVSALPSGQARRANLLKLHDRAIQFEGFVASFGIPSLRRFVEFIEKLQERGQDWSPAEPTACAGNAVRILSVHKSKGLEFPVVFLAELESRFNKKDIYADCLADAEDTLGLQIIDRKSNRRLRSLAHEVIAQTRLATMLAEEMRILYVATTRARERLILTASQKRKTCTEIVTNGFYFGEGSLPAWLLGAYQSPLDWILYAFSDRKALHEALQTGLASQCRDDSLFTFTFHGQTELAELSQFVINLKKAKSSPHKERRTKPGECKAIINSQLSIINQSLAWQYRFGDAPSLPAKTSVSELTHRNDEFVRLDYSKALDRRPACLAAAEPGRAGTLDSRLLGSATHLAIAALDLHRPVTRDAIETAMEKLAADGAIGESVAAQIDTDSILTFFQGDLGRLALDAQNRVHREWPFTFALPASEWHSPSDARQTMDDGGQTTGGSLKRSLGMAAPDTPHASRFTSDESIVVQGIIDMLIRTPQGLVVIDFKTDSITASHATQRAELYRGQLDLYAKAAAKILNAESIAEHLYFLTPRVVVRL